MATPTVNIEYGNLHPFDESTGKTTDTAHSAARGMVAMMQDYPEMNAALEAMDDVARTEFVCALADIMRVAQMRPYPA